MRVTRLSPVSRRFAWFVIRLLTFQACLAIISGAGRSALLGRRKIVILAGRDWKIQSAMGTERLALASRSGMEHSQHFRFRAAGCWSALEPLLTALPRSRTPITVAYIASYLVGIGLFFLLPRLG